MGKELVAMILAGGKGTRLYELTKKDAKPAVHFGGKYRIIDYALSNCAHSNIDTVGVLTQYESISLSRYIGNGEKWGLNGVRSSTVAIPPRQTETGSNWFLGTADAIYQNLEYLDALSPENVLILSGDHIYKMDYSQMLLTHQKNNADLTIAVLDVSVEEAKRFGILSADDHDRITEFEEKPRNPKSTLASMGIYIFNYKVLKQSLNADARDEDSEHDFGKNIIPTLLEKKKRLFVHRFNGYWKDVGTIDSLWEANMDLIKIMDEDFYSVDKYNLRLYSEDTNSVPHYVGKKASVKRSIVNQGAIILGSVEGSIISNEAFIENGAFVKDSVIMPGVVIGRNAYINKAIVVDDLVLADDVRINEGGERVVLVHKGGVK